MAYAYVGIVVPSRQPVRSWSEHALTATEPAEAGYDEHELGGWFVRADFVDERIRGDAVLARLDAAPASLHRDPLLRLYGVIDAGLTITHRAQLEHDHWRVRLSNRAWVAHLRSILTPTSTLAIAIVHIVTPARREPAHVPADQRDR